MTIINCSYEFKNPANPVTSPNHCQIRYILLEPGERPPRSLIFNYTSTLRSSQRENLEQIQIKEFPWLILWFKTEIIANYNLFTSYEKMYLNRGLTIED